MSKKTTILGAITTILVLLVLGGILFSSQMKRSQNTFTGTVANINDCAANIGASTCTWDILVDDKESIKVTWSQVINPDNSDVGGPVGFKFTDDITGKKVEVYAEPTGSNEYSISTKGHYIKLKP